MDPAYSAAPAIFDRARSFGDDLAIVDLALPDRRGFSYRQLLDAADTVAAALLEGPWCPRRASLAGARVAFLVPPSFDYAALMWGIWRAGGIAVPLALSHPRPELEYVVDDCDAALVVVHPDLADRLAPIARERDLHLLRSNVVLAGERVAGGEAATLPVLGLADPALIAYTSGTTGSPKGAVLSHGNIQAQVESLVEAWAWSRRDRILEMLPLHHVHGIINVLTCCLYAGAVCEILPRFDAAAVWERLASGRLTLLMAVPTIYVRLIAAWEEADAERQQALSAAAAKLRLMVSGSAALPVPVLERWREISGQVLLERYGMTEIGMALSNPLDGARVAGAVGSPLPGVEIRLVDEAAQPVADAEPGTLEVRGAAVFREYWCRDAATRESFRDGWFQTGDVAVREDGVYRLLGRSSVDIIKCGGEKISALEIESVLADHPAIRECAVVGVADPEWGQRVTAAVVLADGAVLDLESLRVWARERLAIYKVPSRLHLLAELPRNAMGKVTKPAVTEIIERS